MTHTWQFGYYTSGVVSRGKAALYLEGFVQANQAGRTLVIGIWCYAWGTVSPGLSERPEKVIRQTCIVPRRFLSDNEVKRDEPADS